jgi:uncharacterized protein (UPF0333 family)
MIKKGEVSMQFIVIITIIVVSLLLIILFVAKQGNSSEGMLGLLKDIFFSARR